MLCGRAPLPHVRQSSWMKQFRYLRARMGVRFDAVLPLLFLIKSIAARRYDTRLQPEIRECSHEKAY